MDPRTGSALFHTPPARGARPRAARATRPVDHAARAGCGPTVHRLTAPAPVLDAILPLQGLVHLDIGVAPLPTTNGGMRKTKDEFEQEIGSVCYRNHVRMGIPGLVPVSEDVRSKSGNARLRVRAKDLELLKAAFSHIPEDKFKDWGWPEVAEEAGLDISA